MLLLMLWKWSRLLLLFRSIYLHTSLISSLWFMLSYFCPLYLCRISKGSNKMEPLKIPSHNAEVKGTFTLQKMKFSIKQFSSECDQIRRKVRIWSHLLEKSLVENFIFVQCLSNLKPFETNIDVLYISTRNKTFIQGKTLSHLTTK